MRICWEQLLFSAQTKYETIALLYQPLSVHPVLLCSLLLTQHLQENQHLKNREPHPLVIAAVGISSRPRRFLLPMDSQSSGLALLNSHFVALACSLPQDHRSFFLSISLPTVRSWSLVVQTSASDCGTFAKSSAVIQVRAQFKWKLNTVMVASRALLSVKTIAASLAVVEATRPFSFTTAKRESVLKCVLKAYHNNFVPHLNILIMCVNFISLLQCQVDQLRHNKFFSRRELLAN